MYRSVAQLDSLSNLLATWFPSYFVRFPLPEPSVQGRAVYALRLRAGGGGERRGVMVVGGTHSRELMNPDAIIELAVDLFISHATGSDVTYGNRTWSATDIKLILETLDLWLVPCMNPDGREYVMNIDTLWRKNRRDNPGTECDGVDLNRNFDVLWGVTQGQTSCAQCSDVYCGPEAFSEPETRNIRSVLDTRQVNCFVDVHSYSELVLWPWGHAPTQTVDPTKRFTTLPSGTCAPIGVAGYQEYMPPRDLQRFQTVGSRIVSAISSVRGRVYTSEPSIALYPTTGTQSDYAYSRHIANPKLRKTYGFTFETGPWVGNVADSFHPADPTLVKRDAKAGMIALMQQCICAIELIGARFLATDAEVTELRRIRDEVLATTEAGRASDRTLRTPTAASSDGPHGGREAVVAGRGVGEAIGRAHEGNPLAHTRRGRRQRNPIRPDVEQGARGRGAAHRPTRARKPARGLARPHKRARPGIPDGRTAPEPQVELTVAARAGCTSNAVT